MEPGSPLHLAVLIALAASCFGMDHNGQVNSADLDFSVGAPPPGPSPGRPWIWLSAKTVSSDGAQLAAAVVNPTKSPITYGVSGAFERWNGKKWTSSGTWSTALDFWGG